MSDPLTFDVTRKINTRLLLISLSFVGIHVSLLLFALLTYSKVEEVSSAFNKHRRPTTSVCYFSQRSRLLFPLNLSNKKDSLKLSSKIKLIVKSLWWLVCSFYLNFKIIIKRSGLIAHSLSIVVEIVATHWLRHLTDLGVA